MSPRLFFGTQGDLEKVVEGQPTAFRMRVTVDAVKGDLVKGDAVKRYLVKGDTASAREAAYMAVGVSLQRRVVTGTRIGPPATALCVGLECGSRRGRSSRGDAPRRRRVRTSLHAACMQQPGHTTPTTRRSAP